MFNKIWYPEEELVAVSDHMLHIYLLPFLILGFFVSFKILITLMVLVLIAAKVVRVRGAMTLELDPENMEVRVALAQNRKGKVLAFSVIFGAFILISAIFVPKKYMAILIISVALVPFIVIGLFAYSYRTTLIQLSLLTVSTFAIISYFSVKLAAVVMAIMLLFGWPIVIESAIKTERFLKGDLQRKLPPSAASTYDFDMD